MSCIPAMLLAAILLGESFAWTGERPTAWLVVAASDRSPVRIARTAKDLASKGVRVFVFQSGDCGETRNVFGIAIEISETVDVAKAALDRVTHVVQNAYIKRCAVVPRSLLAHRFSAVDLSIADVPSDALNWDDSDRVSSIVRLSDGRDLIVIRAYADDPEDVLEGKRVGLLLPIGLGKGKVLEDDCTWPAQFQESHGVIAFQCATEEAGDQLLHSVSAFDLNGDPIARVARCRGPVLSDGVALTCKAESVDAKGRLKLQAKRIPLAHSPASIQEPSP